MTMKKSKRHSIVGNNTHLLLIIPCHNLTIIKLFICTYPYKNLLTPSLIMNYTRCYSKEMSGTKYYSTAVRDVTSVDTLSQCAARSKFESFRFYMCSIVTSTKSWHKIYTRLGWKTSIKQPTQKKVATLGHVNWGVVYPEVDKILSCLKGVERRFTVEALASDSQLIKIVIIVYYQEHFILDYFISLILFIKKQCRFVLIFTTSQEVIKEISYRFKMI